MIFSSLGATFAYFSLTVGSGASTPSQTETTTAKLGETEFTLTNDSSWTQSKLEYPGGIAIMKTEAKAAFTGESTTGNAYDFKFQLKLTGTSTVGTELKWHLYELDEGAQTTLQESLQDKFGIDSCTLKVETSGTETKLYYENDGHDCDVQNLGIQAQLSEYEIAGGTLKSEGGLTNTVVDKGVSSLTAMEREIKNVSKGQEGKKYYYLVVEYPNQESNQATTDAGQTINVKLELVEGSVKAEQHAN